MDNGERFLLFFFGKRLHANEQSAEFSVVSPPLIDQCIDSLPAAQAKIAHAKIGTI